MLVMWTSIKGLVITFKASTTAMQPKDSPAGLMMTEASLS